MPIGASIMDKIVAPHYVGLFRLRNAHIRTTMAPRLASRQTQAQLLPQPLDAAKSYADPHRRASISKTRIALRYPNKPLPQQLILQWLSQSVARDSAAHVQIPWQSAAKRPHGSGSQWPLVVPAGKSFFPENSFKPSITSSRSATKRLSFAFSDSSTLSRRTSDTSMPQNLLRHRKNVCSATLCLRQTSHIYAPLCSASRRIRTETTILA